MPGFASLITKFDDTAGVCEVAAVSVLSGKLHKKTLKITRTQFLAWQIDGFLIQEAMPLLSASEREFLLTGATDEEWNNTFGDNNKEEPL